MKTHFLGKVAAVFSGILITLGCSSKTAEYKNPVWKSGGITSLETITLGGVPHSVLIRGTDINLPVLLVIHGYAVPMMPFAHLDNPDKALSLENKFIVVHYDQRGVGKTARHKSPDDSYKADQFVSDAEELTAILRKRFNRKKIVILGISWGSMIGMKLAQKHPDWFHAFISEGQMVYLPESYGQAKEFSVENAKIENNTDALKELSKVSVPDKNNPLDQNIRDIDSIIKWLDYYQQKKYKLRDLKKLFFASIWAAPEYTFLDFLSTLSSIKTFTRATTQELLGIDMRKEVPAVQIPVYFIMGEHDIMLFAGKNYFDLIKAPKKEWIVIKNAGHAASADQPEDVQKLYFEKIFPEIIK